MISHGVTQRLKPSQNWPKENTTASFKTENCICNEIFVLKTNAEGSSEDRGRNLGLNYILCLRAAKTLVSLCICTGPSDPSLHTYAISTKSYAHDSIGDMFLRQK